MNAQTHPAPTWRDSTQAARHSYCAQTEVEAGYLLPQLLVPAELPTCRSSVSALARLWRWLAGGRASVLS
jgi:hypothetical protein